MDPVVELVLQLEPDTAPPSVDLQARQREALLRSMAQAGHTRTPSRHWRPRHSGWFVALAGAAAAAVVVTILVPGSSPSRRPPAPAPATSAVLAAITTALTETSADIEQVQSTVSGAPLSTTSWVDLASGSCRTDTSVNGQLSLTLFDESGNAVIIDYGKKEWWTRGTEGVTCEPLLTPQIIEHALTTGQYTVAGHAVLDGQPSLKLVSTATSSGLHPMAKLAILWVNATTYLPIQSSSTGHLTEQTVFTWVPATATNTARLHIAVPAGFRQVAPPATHVKLLPQRA